ncbi:polyprotein [Phytophthora palmivora]|uniref:Polyprotein n=1 Tax=Phytophthora palmivora TaxID=4796 RepID=A0A2P4X2R1_9STRA|nr:polyprotein [Phytophthora palmivora]
MGIINGAPYRRIVVLSSVEAEYMTLYLVYAGDAMGSSAVERHSGSHQGLRDNQGAIALASNADYNARTKHVDIKHHFICENVARNIVQVNYVSTERQLADMLTKALRLKYLMDLSEVVAKPAEH